MLYRFDHKEPHVDNDTYVSKSTVVIGDVHIGANCYIGHGAILRGDYGRIEIGNGSAIEEGVIIHAPPDDSCVIGDKVTIGHGAIVHAQVVGDRATIGMGAILSIKAEVGAGTIIAEGAIVKASQKIPENVVAGGNPARILRKVTQKDHKFWDWGKQLYIDLAKKYLNSGMERIDRSEEQL